MEHIIVDLIDDIKCISLTEKGWNYVTTAVLILSGIYWVTLCDNGLFYQLTGIISYFGSVILWIKKNSWAKRFIDGEYFE